MAATEEEAARQAIIGACLSMNYNGINQGTAGNISVRWENGLLITPSGLPYDEMKIDDIVFMNMDGSYEHRLAASSEWRFHRDILQERVDVNAVVHAHPVHATAFAICGMEVPAVHYMIAAAGGPSIRCAPYAPYGTEELSRAVLKALSGRACALLANDGRLPPDMTSARRCGLPSKSKRCASKMRLRFRSGPRVRSQTTRSKGPLKNSRSIACGPSNPTRSPIETNSRCLRKVANCLGPEKKLVE